MAFANNIQKLYLGTITFLVTVLSLHILNHNVAALVNVLYILQIFLKKKCIEN